MTCELPDAEPTSYVGRRDEAAQVRRLLGDRRLVTLTGCGGIGKTRLARRVAGEIGRAHTGGAVFVELSELADGAALAATVADRLDLRLRSGESITGRVLEYLRERRVLLIMDNCEHVLTACAEFVTAVLADCPRVTVLATSRQSLGVPGEHVVRVPPLPVPADETGTPAQARTFDAVRLFVDRARAASSEFTLTAANCADVVRLCRTLDGVPLAIELAAARMRSLSPRQALERWSGQLALSTAASRTGSPRQQTLRAALDWSYDLCTEVERAVWRRLAVFAGSFALDSAEFLCGDTAAVVVDTIDGLVDKSILERHGDAVLRYRMLEPVREYGLEQLRAAGELDGVARRHRDWFHRVVRAADDGWMSAAQLDWVWRLRRDHADLLVGLEYSLNEPGGADIALSMACRVPEYWTLRGANRAARTWLDRALAAASPEHPQRAYAEAVAAWHSLWLADLDDAHARLARAEEVLAPGDARTEAMIMAVGAHAAKIVNDNALAAKLAAVAMDRFRELGDLRFAVAAANLLALATITTDSAESLRVLDAAVADCERCGETYYRDVLLFALCLTHLARGDCDAAEGAARRGLASTIRRDSRFGDAYHIESLSWIACLRGEYERSARLSGAVATCWEMLGADPEVILVVPYTRCRDANLRALGDAGFAERFAAGRAMSLERARRDALGEDEPPAAAAEPLTARELEVAELVALGLTNREIANRLAMAHRTADTHVRNILAKLGIANRARIAAWITDRVREKA